MLNLQLENLGGYASKLIKLHRLIPIVALVQVSSDEVVSFCCFHFIPFKILDFPMFKLKTIDNKIKGCCSWTASIHYDNLCVLFTYFHDNLGQKITYVEVHCSWRGYWLLLLVHAVVLLRLIMVLLSYSLGFLI